MTKAHIILTRKEALDRLGIRKDSLHFLEQAAKLRRDRRRHGYTDKEFRCLLAKLKKILGQNR